MINLDQSQSVSYVCTLSSVCLYFSLWVYYNYCYMLYTHGLLGIMGMPALPPGLQENTSKRQLHRDTPVTCQAPQMAHEWSYTKSSINHLCTQLNSTNGPCRVFGKSLECSCGSTRQKTPRSMGRRLDSHQGHRWHYKISTVTVLKCTLIARIVDYVVLWFCTKCPSFVSNVFSLTHSCATVVWHMRLTGQCDSL